VHQFLQSSDSLCLIKVKEKKNIRKKKENFKLSEVRGKCSRGSLSELLFDIVTPVAKGVQRWQGDKKLVCTNA